MLAATSVELFSRRFRRLLEFFLKTAAVSVSITFGTALALYSPTTMAGEAPLAWDASTSSNVGGYRIHYGLSSGNYPNKVFVGNQTSYTLSGLDGGQTYYIAITAHEAVGFKESAFSVEVVAEIPLAAFTGTPEVGVSPLTVAFSDVSTGNISSRSWDFGDGTTSTARKPKHVYADPGQYTVSVVVTGASGADSDTKTAYITVDLDTDGDGMGDVFENRFGLNPNDPDDAGLDRDADGISNLEEFRAGTNPNVNEAAVLQIINSILFD